MLTQTALLYSAFIVSIFAFSAALLIKEPVGARKAKPFYLAFYFSSLILFYLISEIPAFESAADSIMLDVVFGLFISFLTIGITIRYGKPALERTAYVLLVIYLFMIIVLQNYYDFNKAFSFIFMLINGGINIIAVLSRKPRPNRADYGLVMALMLWLLMAISELSTAEVVDPKSYFFSDFMIFQMLFIPANIFGITVFLLASYLMDSNTLLERLATKDELTDMLNRRALFDQIDSQISYLKRRESEAAVIIADIDNFKRINDTYGHEAGDKVIQAFASIILSSIRGYDVAARYGGEEFLIFLPNADMSAAHSVAERMRQETEQIQLQYKEDAIVFTASFGIAEYQLDKSADISIANADQALYHSKRSGRNQVSEFELAAE